MPIQLCNQIKSDGVPCQSPALRGKFHCYFHGHRPPAPRPAAQASPESPRTEPGLYLPPLHDAESIVHAVSNICQAVAQCHIPLSRARLLLKAIELARLEMAP